MEFDHSPSPYAAAGRDRRRSTSAVHDGEELQNRLTAAVEQRLPSRIQKVLGRLQAIGGVALRSCATQVAAAQRLLALLELLDGVDLVVQKIEFDHHSRFAAMQHGHINVTLRKEPGVSFGVVFAKSKLVDPATGREFKSLNCKRMKFQGKPYNVRGCVNGDVLLEVNGQPVTTAKELNEVIGDLNAVVLKINRSLPQALGIEEMEAALQQLVGLMDRIDALPVPAPRAPDNMTPAEVALFDYAREVSRRTKQNLAVLMLLQAVLGPDADAEDRAAELPELWDAACKLRLDKQVYPADNEVAQLVARARREVGRSRVPRSPPPPPSQRTSTRAPAASGGAGSDETSDGTDDDMPGAPLSPRVIEATKASVQRRLDQQKFLNTPTQEVEFERRSKRGMTEHDLGRHDVAARTAEQTVVERALSRQAWVGMLEHAADADGTRTEQWAGVRFRAEEWAFDERMHDFVLTLTARGVLSRLAAAAAAAVAAARRGRQRGGDEVVIEEPLELSGNLFLRTRQVVLRRRSGGRYQQVFHGSLLGLESSVPRVIAETVRGEAVRLELTRAGAVTSSPPQTADGERGRPEFGAPGRRAVVDDGGSGGGGGSCDDGSYDSAGDGESEGGQLTEKEFMAQAAQRIQQMVNAEQDAQRPATRVLEKKSSKTALLVATVGRVGRELASEGLASTPISRAGGTDCEWDEAPGSDDDGDDDDEDEGDDVADVGMTPGDKRRLVRNPSNRMLNATALDVRRNRLVADMRGSGGGGGGGGGGIVGGRSGSSGRSGNKLVGTGTQAQKYAFSLLLEGCTGVRFAWTKFHGIKTAGELGLVNGSPAFSEILRWQQKGLRTSVTRVAGSAKMAAIKMYKYIRAFCGDKKLRPKKEYREIVSALVSTCLSHSLEDELYCQLCKHLTENQIAWSETKAWELLLICLFAVPVSAGFQSHLLNFVVRRHGRFQSMHDRNDEERSLAVLVHNVYSAIVAANCNVACIPKEEERSELGRYGDISTVKGTSRARAERAIAMAQEVAVSAQATQQRSRMVSL